jgi:acetyl esterase/lipase
MHLRTCCLLLVILCSASSLAAAGDRPSVRVESNVVYGMYSGLALLMDVHRPSNANGYGVLFIPYSGWNAWLHYGATQLKNDERQLPVFLPHLLDAGYTVFVINHRATPRFPHPAQVQDAQRAVRFIRNSARAFGIDPDRIGVVGVSTGGHLANMLGVLDPGGLVDSMDPVNHVSAAVQCVVAFSTLTDFTTLPEGSAWQNIALLTAGQKHTFFNLPVDKRQALPDFFAETVNWLDTYLRHGPGAPTQ